MGSLQDSPKLREQKQGNQDILHGVNIQCHNQQHRQYEPGEQKRSNTVYRENAGYSSYTTHEETMLTMEDMKVVREKKKRLSLEQVEYLEASFEAVNKLEPERKAAIAHQLDLDPRQVAVWFQNRRARSKSKKLESDYVALRAKYNAMFLENQELKAEMDRMRRILQERGNGKLEEGNAIQECTWIKETKSNAHVIKETSKGNVIELVHNEANEMQSYELSSPTISTANDTTSTSSLPQDIRWTTNLEFLMYNHVDDYQLLFMQNHVDATKLAHQSTIKFDDEDEYSLQHNYCYNNSYQNDDHHVIIAYTQKEVDGYDIL